MKLSTYLASRQLDESAIACILGVTPEAAGQWLAGNSVPRFEQMQKIMLATGGMVTPADFIPVTELPPVPKPCGAAE